MQDRAIAAIGAIELEKNKGLETVDLYVENMFPGKDYQMLLLVFEILNNNGELICEYKGIDTKKVNSEKEDYRKYAYRKGTSGRAGDVTITTKLTLKKLENIRDKQFKKLIDNDNFIKESELFTKIYRNYFENYNQIQSELKNFLNGLAKKDKETFGISIKILTDNSEKYLYDFEIVKENIRKEYYLSKISQDNTIAKKTNSVCSITDKIEKNIFGFAAPFKYSTFDKPGFISGFFNKKQNWRNYPVSEEEALKLELGRRYIRENLNSYFYGHEYVIVPHPIIKTEKEKLKNIIRLIKGALISETGNKEKKKRSEERVLKLIAQEKNYFNVDILFFQENKTNKSMKINLMLEEILPSRFRQLFIEAPAIVNSNHLFKNVFPKTDKPDLKFSFYLLKQFFSPNPKGKQSRFNSPFFLKIVNDVFLGNRISEKYLFEKILYYIRMKYKENLEADKKYNNALKTPVIMAIMIISYLQELKIINYNKNYKYMEVENTKKKESRFNLNGFNDFVKENSNFLDSDVKVGVFAVGVLVKLLFDTQAHNLDGNTPFENKLRGYKLNPELLMNVYTEALDKIQKYQNFYTYMELREVINRYFIVKSNELNQMTNNELSFYFVAGLELGKQFKNKDENEDNK